MANTTNFGWETPDDTDLVKDGAAAIRTLGSAIDTSLMDLEGGTTGQVLAKNSNTDMDFIWVTSDDANAIQNSIVDAKGDIIAASANDTPARLAVGTNNHRLVAASGEATGLKYVADTQNTVIDAAGDLVYGTAADTLGRLAIGTAGQILQVNSGATAPEWTTPTGGGSGLTLITPTSIANSGGSASLTGALTVATGVTSVSINGVFSATYTNYLIEVFAISAVSAGGIATRLRAAGTDTAGSNYQYGQNVVTYAGVGSVGGLTTASNWDVGTGSVSDCSASTIFLFNPFASTKTNYHSVHTRNVAYGASGGMQTDTTSFDGISFIGGGTDISLSVLVYGFAK